MYIKETTGKERLIIAGAVGDAFCNLERAHRMLYRLWEDHFESREQKDIKAYDAKDMGDLIYTIEEIRRAGRAVHHQARGRPYISPGGRQAAPNQHCRQSGRRFQGGY